MAGVVESSFNEGLASILKWASIHTGKKLTCYMDANSDVFYIFYEDRVTKIRRVDVLSCSSKRETLAMIEGKIFDLIASDKPKSGQPEKGRRIILGD